MTRRCNLRIALISVKSIICKWFVSGHMKTFWNNEANLFFKTTGNAWKNSYYQGPKLHEGHTPSFTKIGHCVLIREAKVYLWRVHLYRQRDNWNLSGPSSIAGGPQSVSEACSYVFKGGGVTKILAPGQGGHKNFFWPMGGGSQNAAGVFSDIYDPPISKKMVAP